MRGTTRGLVLVAIIAVACGWAGAAPKKPRPAAKAGAVDRLQQHFKQADTDFKHGDRKAAAAELWAAAELIREEIGRASGPARKLLESVPGELDKAANKIGTIDQKTLRRTFARAYRAMAAYHHRLASNAWVKRERRQAGAYLQAAGADLRHAAAWAGPTVERAYVTAAAYALDVSEKLFHGSKVKGQQVEKALKGLGKQIDALGRRLERAK